MITVKSARSRRHAAGMIYLGGLALLIGPLLADEWGIGRAIPGKSFCVIVWGGSAVICGLAAWWLPVPRVARMGWALLAALTPIPIGLGWLAAILWLRGPGGI